MKSLVETKLLVLHDVSEVALSRDSAMLSYDDISYNF